MVQEEGIEPSRIKDPPDFESGASASSATPADPKAVRTIAQHRERCQSEMAEEKGKVEVITERDEAPKAIETFSPVVCGLHFFDRIFMEVSPSPNATHRTLPSASCFCTSASCRPSSLTPSLPDARLGSSLNGSLKTWGRIGFDGNREAREACRGCHAPRKTRGKPTTANTELALAA